MASSPVQLRPAQQEVLTYNGGRMGIAAVPGAGKTFIIEQLVVQLIESGTPPDRIGVGTYTRSAKGNLAQKFVKYGRVQVFTLHSLSLQILKEFYPGSFDFNIQEDYQQERLINDLVSAWMELHRSVWQSWLPPKTNQINEQTIRTQLTKGTKTIISKAKQQRLYPPIKTESGSLLGIALELYDRYQQKLAEQKLIDYDDMVIKALLLLEENDRIRELAQGWFDYLLEDEAQDSSALQAKMLDILSERSGNLVRVGDPNQCIMSTFSNSEPAIFRDFCQKYQRHTLDQSSRSSQKIIDLANYLVDWTNNHHPLLELRSALKHQLIRSAGDNPDNALSEINFNRFEGDKKIELEKIVDRACLAITERPNNTLAILVPTNQAGNDVLDLLKQREVKSNDLLRNNRNAKQIVSIILHLTAFLAIPTEIEVLLSALGEILTSYGISEAQIILVKRSLSTYFPEDLLYFGGNQSVFLPTILGLEAKTEAEVINLLKLFASWLDQSNLPWDELLRLILQYLQQSPEDSYIGNYVISQLENSLSDHELVDWASISYEVSQILDCPLSNLPNEIQNYEPIPGVITVLTDHRSKGLEWDEVFIVDCSAYQFPVTEEDRTVKNFDIERDMTTLWQQFFSSDLTPRGNFVEVAAERIRLLYVAITRAKVRLTLSVSTTWNDKEQRSSLLFDRLEEFDKATQLLTDGDGARISPKPESGHLKQNLPPIGLV